MKNTRLLTLDIFRGMTMIFMVIVNNPGDWANIYWPLDHAKWNGCTPTDLVFPFFIFAMGMAIPFSIDKFQTLNKTVYWQIGIRALRIFCLGLLLNFFSKINLGSLSGFLLMIIRMAIMIFVSKYLFANGTFGKKQKSVLIIIAILFILAFSGLGAFQFVRIPGVLQRIGIVYFVCAMIYLRYDFKNSLILAGGLLVLYFLMMKIIPAGLYGRGNLAYGRNLAAYLDYKLLKNHLWVVTKTWDPEGFLSTIPAIVSGLIGVFAGEFIKLKKEKIELNFIRFGIAFVITGLLWNFVFPINKSLWSSSYVLFSSGWALIIFGFLYLFLENKTQNKAVVFLQMWGVNPIIVFFGSGLIPRALGMINFSSKIEGFPTEKSIGEIFYQKMIFPIFNSPYNSSLCMALLHVVFWSIILWKLKSKNIILKV